MPNSHRRRRDTTQRDCQILDRFSRFCTADACAQHTDTRTQRPRRIYTPRAGDATRY